MSNVTSLMIVEDEDMLRDALTNAVDWAGLGYEVLSVADGEAALEAADAREIDIVVTDIRMPVMDGLQLAAALKARHPQTLVAILSGHDEFAYAQEALSLGVLEYLTKPITPEELIAVVNRLARVANRERAKVRTLETMRRQLEESMPLYRRRLLNQMVEGSVTGKNLRERMDFSGLLLKGEGFTVCLIECEQDEALCAQSRALTEFAALDLTQREAGTDAVAFQRFDGALCLIYCARTKQAERERVFVKHLIGEICQNLYDQLDIGSTAAIGVPVPDIESLPVSYQSALSAMALRVLRGKYELFDAYECEEEKAHYPFEDVRMLLSRLNLGSRDEVSEALRGFFCELRKKSGLTEENLRVLMIDLANGGQKLLIEAGLDGLDGSRQLYEELFRLRTIEEYEQTLSRDLLDIHARLESARDQGGGRMIETVCAYIQENFTKNTLSLENAAQKAYISPTYLSILFKRKLGVTFSEYVIHLRMERAKELLRLGDVRTYTVAAQTGYNDPQYFSSCFKKYTGMTPTEYRAKPREAR